MARSQRGTHIVFRHAISDNGIKTKDTKFMAAKVFVRVIESRMFFITMQVGFVETRIS